MPDAADQDIVHDVAYDHYGRRVATCSSDNTIKVFDAAGQKVAEWRAHSGSIWRLSWAHPEFGVALASCSFDRKVCVWEEFSDAEELLVLDETKVAQWTRAAEISDARDSVVDVQFAPHHMGARIASCSADGFVRVHEAPDVLDLSSWERHSEFDASANAADAADGSTATSVGVSLGGGGLGGGGSASTLGGSGSTLGGSNSSLGGDGADLRGLEPLCLAWCTSLVERAMLCVGGADGSVVVWAFDEESGWARTLVLGGGGGGGGARAHQDCVRSVSWAADVGRSYELVASASRDTTVKLWAIRRPGGGAEDEAAGGWAVAPHAEGRAEAAVGGWSARCVCELPHRSQVWRVSWNGSGSMLACSEDDGTVRVFKMDASGGWREARPVPVA